MDKSELEKILASLDIPYNEGIQNDKNTNVYPRIVYWEYGWNPIMGSGKEYDTKVIYQVSFFSKIPRHPKLIKLKKKLAEVGLNPYIEHEYVQKEQYWHSFFSVEVVENLDEITL